MILFFYAFILFYSNNLFADDFIVGKWSGKSNNNKHVYSLDITKDVNGVFLSYIFIYDGGRKINDKTSAKFPLKQTSEQCWRGEATDFFNEERTKVTLCKQGDSLVWETELSILYVPKFEVFIE